MEGYFCFVCHTGVKKSIQIKNHGGMITSPNTDRAVLIWRIEYLEPERGDESAKRYSSRVNNMKKLSLI